MRYDGHTEESDLKGILIPRERKKNGASDIPFCLSIVLETLLRGVKRLYVGDRTQ